MAELDNIALVRRWFDEVWNQRRLETIDELLAPDARCFDMTAPDSIIVGPESFRAAAAQMHAAFGEMQLTIEDIFASGDRVAVRLTGRLKHTGPLGPLPATNRDIAVPIMCIIHVRDGKLIAGWNNWDIGGVLRTAAAPAEQRALF
jgi:predicted ester cyclase